MSPYCAPDMAESFRHNALFVGGNVREAVNDGRADYMPIFLSEIEASFESGEMPIDVALIQVSLLIRTAIAASVSASKHPDGSEERPQGCRPGKRADAANLWRQLHSRQQD